MSWQVLSHPDIQAFIRKHETTDVKTLALKPWPDDHWPKAIILDQIKARQKAAVKMPQWHQDPHIIFPPADIVEQASSTATALYKGSLFSGASCADLTAGCGMDSWAFGQSFKTLHCVERDSNAAQMLEHNFKTLRPHAKIHNASAEEFIKTMPHVDLIYIDPQRRNDQRRGIFKLDDCSPNILDLLPALKTRTNDILIKTSPMIDIDSTCKILENVQNVYITEHEGQCKEALFHISAQTTTTDPQIHAVRLNHDGTVYDSLSFHKKRTNALNFSYKNPQKYLYEPSAAYQKSDAMQAISDTFPVAKIAPDTHLFTSETHIENFPGRTFEVTGMHTPHKKSLPFKKANLTVRNFPSSVEDLRKKLKLSEGGEDYLFACTLKNNDKVIISTRKIL